MIKKISKKAGLSPGTSKNLMYLGLAAVVIFFAVKFGSSVGKMFRAITDGLGITEPQVLEDATTDPTGKGQPFTPTYFLNNAEKTTFYQDTADVLAQQIKDAYGFLSFDFEQVMGAIKMCKNQIDVSFVSFTFYRLFDRDMLGFLKSPNTNINFPWCVLSPSELTTIVEYANNLPQS